MREIILILIHKGIIASFHETVIKQSAKNGSSNFEINNKLHNMKTRNEDKLKISFCHTERSKKNPQFHKCKEC